MVQTCKPDVGVRIKRFQLFDHCGISNVLLYGAWSIYKHTCTYRSYSNLITCFDLICNWAGNKCGNFYG